ncbi:F0F1 ATP synthase subunit B [Falsirhodobacter sp. alg1]|uniref:F0F1 ATP synthase subunit B n=1 Tax=Falsirhodobacter sp. alg1 TaxID=1472418 RepID=UPI0005EF1B51|nr:F0F1 ATP synthase subunit B [Falsirhodobacter sp. alg1]
MKKLSIGLSLLATPALAAGPHPFFSLYNTNLIVGIAFLLFLAILVWAKVPHRIAGMLDKRAGDIRSELDEARALREEAKTLLASYERKQKEVMEQSERIVAKARQDATYAAEQAKVSLEETITRRVKSAEDQIAAAEKSAVNEIREQAIEVAVAAARDVLARQMTPDARSASIDTSLDQVQAKLH